jgi:hypothetical protein
MLTDGGPVCGRECECKVRIQNRVRTVQALLYSSALCIERTSFSQIPKT